MKSKRLTISESRYEDLKYSLEKMLKFVDDEIKKEYEFEVNTLNEMINDFTDIEFSPKKSLAANKATKARTEKAKTKIEKTINIFRIEGKKITINAISKNSGVAYNTVKKYITKDFVNSFNEMI